jgi:Rrf2 family protein
MSHPVKLSEAASLALHTMALLARPNAERFTTQEIARQLGASEHHLAKVLQRLGKAGLVDSTRGPQGGFQLSRPAAETKLLEVYEAVEGPLPEGGCLLSDHACPAELACIMGELVRNIHGLFRAALTDTSLEQLAFGAAILKKNESA